MDADAKAATLEAELGIDAESLRSRYRAERDRRLRDDDLGQYVEITGRYDRYRDDPWADPDFTRAPLTDAVDVIVIGGGIGGLLAGAQLRKQGVENIRMVEKGADFGGVWYWNRYPGAACDTQSFLYMPMLEELGVMPQRRFAHGPEILEHWRRIARQFDLYRDAQFQTEVTGLRWDDEDRQWIVSTNRDDAMRARFVVVALGPMERPKLAGIAGLDNFKGHSFHTSRWDYAYTGGGPEGGLTGLADKAVGIIGTGASSIQCVPHLGASARHLTVFQRTPSTLDVRKDTDLDPAWVAALEPGWQDRLRTNFTAVVSGLYDVEDMIQDGWTSGMATIKKLVRRSEERGETVEQPMSLNQLADYMKMNEIRDRVDDSVADRHVAALLKPWYNRFCKRPCFHDDYLPTFNRSNVTLVDASAGKGVERITETGVVVDGTDYPLDCLIYSTGFDVGTPFAKRIGYTIAGRGGLTLAEKWAGGAATQHGIASHGFPNLFIMSVVQTGVSLNFTHMIEEQARHVGYIIGRARRENIRMIEVTRAAEEAWCAEIDRAAISQVAFQRECTPSYFNFEGNLRRFNVRNSQYGGGPVAFYRILAEWRDDGTMPGLELTHGASVAHAGAAKSQPAPMPMMSSDVAI